MKKFLLITIAVLFSLSIVTGVALASGKIAVAPVFGACANDGTGLLAKFATSQADCSDAQTFVTWSQAGSKGDKGDAGVPGAPGISGVVDVHTAWTRVNPGVLTGVLCPKGLNVLGGGVALGRGYTHDAIDVSRPDDAGHGWIGAYSSIDGTKTTIKVWAVCATVG